MPSGSLCGQGAADLHLWDLSLLIWGGKLPLPLLLLLCKAWARCLGPLHNELVPVVPVTAEVGRYLWHFKGPLLGKHKTCNSSDVTLNDWNEGFCSCTVNIHHCVSIAQPRGEHIACTEFLL